MQALALALASCMAIDVVHILAKGRHEPEALRAHLAADRAEAEPKRIRAVRLRFTVTGDVPAGEGRAGHRPVAGEVLLGLALAPPGHRLRDRVHVTPA